MPDESPSRSRRLLFAVVMALAGGAYCWLYGRFNPQHTSDFDQVWAAAQALQRGASPYESIGYAKPFFWPWPFYYPLPAALLAWPLGFLPVLAARAAFAGISSGVLAWAITADGWHRWPAFLSIPFVTSLELVQWAPLMTAAVLSPRLAWLGVAKPNWGIVIAAAAKTWQTWVVIAAGAIILFAASFAVQPGWFGEWVPLVRSANHFRAPLLQPPGFLMLLALFRWRRWEARLLVAMCLVPQTPGFYDALVLFAIPRTFRESLALCVAGFVTFFAMVASQPWTTGAEWMADISRFTIWFQYLPAVAIVLMRPNEGAPLLPWRRSVPAPA